MLNLFKENILQEESEFSRDKILYKARVGLQSYLDYIYKSIKVIQQQGAIKINVHKKNSKDFTSWVLDFDSLSDSKAEKAAHDIFRREIKSIFLEPPENKRAKRVDILERNEEERYLVLKNVDNSTEINSLYLKADDYQLQKQKGAILKLLNSPSKDHEPILQLFNNSRHAKTYFERNINYSIEQANIEWKILKNEPRDDEPRNGTSQQQDFVYKALQTEDFALLEGPPGSGKTTAIIELILQLIEQGKRVLLVSATHVAVDNVIHRILTTYKDKCAGKVVPIRIGKDGDIRKDSVKPYQLQSFVRKTKQEIKQNLSKAAKTDSQQRLYNYLKDKDKNDQEFDDIILKSANLVGGTMIGVLQHPDIGNKLSNKFSNEVFDVMIVDESSKVTFLDFIVPALYAKKWILVGDIQQLSPYVEDDYINESIDNVIESKEDKERIIHQFELKKELKNAAGKPWGNYLKVLIFDDLRLNKTSFEDAGEVFCLDDNFDPTFKNIARLNAVEVVLCQNSEKAKNYLAKYVFVKTKIFEGYIDAPSFKNRQKYLHYNRKSKSFDKHYHKFQFVKDKHQEWKEMVGSRLGQYYEYRFSPELAENIKEELDILIPQKEYRDSVDKIRKVALPSILELMQIGIGETISKKGYTQHQIIYEGFKDSVKDLKFQSLDYQHRMNDAIAAIPREYFYKSKNLKTANTVLGRTNPLENYKSSEQDVIWVPNGDRTFRKKDKKGNSKNINPTEKKHIKLELLDFLKFAKHNPKKDGKPYEVAVLTFYRQQEVELKKMLRTLSGQFPKHKFFSIDNVDITLCTVDKFQGDEADLVLLSFVKNTPKAFYNNSNRLNVALTRARFKLVLFGNRDWFERNAMSKALKGLASEYKERLISRNNKRSNK